MIKKNKTQNYKIKINSFLILRESENLSPKYNFWGKDISESQNSIRHFYGVHRS
jgi:hypothetical protein